MEKLVNGQTPLLEYVVRRVGWWHNLLYKMSVGDVILIDIKYRRIVDGNNLLMLSIKVDEEHG